MMNVTGLWAKYGNELRDDPLLVLALTAALFALATTPIAFAVLGRMEWFKARRGRVMQRPEFASIVVGMILVMAIPAIFSALVLKTRYFDKNRYENCYCCGFKFRGIPRFDGAGPRYRSPSGNIPGRPQ